MEKEQKNLQDLRYFVEIQNGDRIHVKYGVPIIADGRCAVCCTLSDIITRREITRVGEVVCSSMQERYIEGAYDRAFERAARAFLKNSFPRIEEKKEPDDAVQGKIHLPEDMMLLFGGLKGSLVGDVLESPEFGHFLEQLLETEDLEFTDEKRNEQLKLLRSYAQERSSTVGQDEHL